MNQQPVNRLIGSGFRLMLVAGMTLLLSHCGHKKEVGTQAPLYQVDDLERNAQSLSTDLGVPVVVVPSNDFDTEYRVAFVLRHLEQNKEAIKGSLAKVDQILLTDHFSTQAVGDRYILSLSIHSNPKTILEYIKTGVEYAGMWADMEALSTRMGVALVDGIGLTPQEFAKLKGNFETISADVLFRQDRSFRSLVILDQTTITSDGATLNPHQNADDLVRDLREIIDARLFAIQHLKDLSQKLNLQITFQDGVFSGPELRRVVENLRVNERSLRLYNRRIEHLILGRRWDEKPNSSPFTVLADAFMLGAEFETALRSFQMEPNTPPMEGHLEVMKTQLQDKGLSLESLSSDLLATVPNEEKLKSFAQDMIDHFDIATALAQGLKSVRITTESVLEYSPVTGTLMVGVDNNASKVNQYLRLNWLQMRYNRATGEIERQTKELKIYLDMGYGLAPSTGDASEQLRISSLESVQKWMAASLTVQALQKTPVSRLKIVKSTNSHEKTSYDFESARLTINLNDFRSEDMGNILKAPEPPAPPAPVPTPEPTPEPAPAPQPRS